MRNLTNAQLAELLDKDIFHKISQAADSLGLECYVVGGYVRDLFLERPSEDIDVVVVGSGISVATALKNILGKCPLLDNGLARVVAVALPTGTDKLHLHIPVFHLCRSEIAEHREVGRLAENVLQRCSHTNAASYNHHVDIF